MILNVQGGSWKINPNHLNILDSDTSRLLHIYIYMKNKKSLKFLFILHKNNTKRNETLELSN